MAQSRKWQLTINNPIEKGFTHTRIKEELDSMSGMLYWCLCDEIGEEETLHTHVYLVLRTPRPHTTIGNRFPGAHREIARGTSQQNRAYVLKDGETYNKQVDGGYDYTDTSNKRHSGVNYSDTFEEWGEMPQEQQGKAKAVDQMYSLIKDGASNLEIVDAVPSAMLRIQEIERTRSMLRDSQFANAWRELNVIYLWGNTGAGKTRSVMERYGYQNCYRVTDYKHPFDDCDGQDILIFEEFRSQIKIDQMLNYLDGYPLLLPCRYFNRQACFTKVFLITNIPLDSQYASELNSETRKAFLRRIHETVRFHADVETLPSKEPEFELLPADEQHSVFR